MGNEPSKSTGIRSSHEAPPMPSLLSPVSEGTSEHRSQGTQWRQGAPEERHGQDWGAASQALSFTSCVTSGLLPAPHYGCLKRSDQVWTQSTWCLARTTTHQCPQETDCTQSCFLGSWLLPKSPWQVVRLPCLSSQLPLVTWGLYGRLVKPPPH